MADNYYSEINLHLVWHTKLSRPLLTREVEPMAWAKLREKILSLGDIFSPRNRWHHWSDEFPRSGAPGEDAIWQDDLPRYLINIRAALTLGEAHEGQLTLWTQVERGAPNWPGLRPDRRVAPEPAAAF